MRPHVTRPTIVREQVDVHTESPGRRGTEFPVLVDEGPVEGWHDTFVGETHLASGR
jgi:hypothetical protein